MGNPYLIDDDDDDEEKRTEKFGVEKVEKFLL